MLKSNISKTSILALSISLLFAVPVYAGTGAGHSGQMNMNKMANMYNMQNNHEYLSVAALYTINNGIIKGNSNGNYKMTDKVKRGDMSIMLVRAFNLANSSDTTIENFFDVSKDSYYYDSIQIIKSLKIAKGHGKNFSPNNNLTLQEAILFVERALDVAGYEYSDEDICDLFKGRYLSDFATREDISIILFAVLENDLTNNTVTSKADNVTYKIDEDTSITFDEDDFNDVCKDATGEILSYVKFTLPSSAYGKLYYDYHSSSDYDSKVNSTAKYYYDADDHDYSISEVTFVPASDYTGTVRISYTGYNEDGDTFTGTIKVTVE